MAERAVNYHESKDILKMAKNRRKITQTALAEKMGMKQNALSAYMLRNRISVWGFVKILNALDYDVVIVDRSTGEAEWKVEEEE